MTGMAHPAERGYKGVTSPPVPLNLADLALDRTQEQTPAAAAAAVAAAAAAVVDSDKLLGAGGMVAEQMLASNSKPSSTQDLLAAGAGSESEGQVLMSKLWWRAVNGAACAGSGSQQVQPLSLLALQLRYTRTPITLSNHPFMLLAPLSARCRQQQPAQSVPPVVLVGPAVRWVFRY